MSILVRIKVVQGYISHVPLKLVAWAQFLFGSHQKLENSICSLTILVLGTNEWVHYKGKLRAWCCYWPATSAAFTSKVTIWPTAKSK